MARKGIIYIMKCISLPGLIKIGKTETKQFESRMRSLEKDGYRHEMLQREFAIEVDDFDSKEKLLHTIYSTSQVGDSELFATNCKAAVELLKSFEGVQIYPVLDKAKPTKTSTTPNRTNTSQQYVVCHMVRKIKAWNNKSPNAKMEIRNGKFIVLAGSEICPVSGIGIQKETKQRYTTASIKNNILQKDESFDSPSGAGNFVCNCAINGWSAWKLDNGDSLQTIRNDLKTSDKN